MLPFQLQQTTQQGEITKAAAKTETLVCCPATRHLQFRQWRDLTQPRSASRAWRTRKAPILRQHDLSGALRHQKAPLRPVPPAAVRRLLRSVKGRCLYPVRCRHRVSVSKQSRTFHLSTPHNVPAPSQIGYCCNACGKVKVGLRCTRKHRLWKSNKND